MRHFSKSQFTNYFLNPREEVMYRVNEPNQFHTEHNTQSFALGGPLHRSYFVTSDRSY